PAGGGVRPGPAGRKNPQTKSTAKRTRSQNRPPRFLFPAFSSIFPIIAARRIDARSGPEPPLDHDDHVTRPVTSGLQGELLIERPALRQRLEIFADFWHPGDDPLDVLDRQEEDGRHAR